MKLIPILGSSMSGSLRGITASRNKGGQYLRGRTTPINPNTTRQQAVRSNLSGLMARWNQELTESEREGWRTYADNVETTNTLGETIKLTGLNWFIAANVVRLQPLAAGIPVLTPVDTAPTEFDLGPGVAGVNTYAGVFTTPPGVITVSGTMTAPAPVGGDVFLYVAPPQNPGKRFFKGPYQFAAALPIAATNNSFTFTDLDLSDGDEWASTTIPVAAWDTLTPPLKLVIVYDDGRTSTKFMELVPFTDATP